MRSEDHTYNMLGWFTDSVITKLDFSVKRPNGTFLQRDTADIDIADKNQITRIIKWLRFENWKQQSDIYVRPARHHDWPIIFLDDLSKGDAERVADLHASMLIHTSQAGGYHAWISTMQPLNETERGMVQRHYSHVYNSDYRSTSGEHWGRLAGFKNHKRGGTDWVNFHATGGGTFIDAASVLSSIKTNHKGSFVPRKNSSSSLPSLGCKSRSIDDSESGKEYGWAIGYIRATGDIEEAKRRLFDKATARGKKGINQYVNRTISKAAAIAAQR